MTAVRHQWVLPLAILAFVGGLGLWYWRETAGLGAAFSSLRDLLPQGGSSEQRGMDMPAMANSPGTESSVPGYVEVTLPGEVRQRIGVTVGAVERAPLRMTVRTVGIVQADETKVTHVHLRTEGWVKKLFVDYTGQKVKQGDPLLAIYSPQFLATQQEYLNAGKAGQAKLEKLARQRLELWDVPADEIEELDRSGQAQTYLTLRSPLSGIVLEKNAFAGQYVMPQTKLYVVADLSVVWVQAKVFEYELPHIELTQAAKVSVPALPEQVFTGKVVFVQPTVEEKTRTVQVRLELPNENGWLKPGMFANVELQHTMGQGLLVPTSAIIRTGERDVAFRVASEARFTPVAVKISDYKFGDRFHVLEGLKRGDRVVTSASFLIDSESRLRAGGGMAGMPGMDMGEMKEMDHSKMKK